MTAYKLTCPESETGEHEFVHYQCARCNLTFDSPYECDFANAAAREIKKLEAEIDNWMQDHHTICSDSELAKEKATRTHDALVLANSLKDTEIRQRDTTIAELREQLARVRVSPTPSSEAREVSNAE